MALRYRTYGFMAHTGSGVSLDTFNNEVGEKQPNNLPAEGEAPRQDLLVLCERLQSMGSTKSRALVGTGK